MAKISSIQKNNRRQKLVEKLRVKRHSIKEKIYNKSTSLDERFSLIMKLNNLPKDSSKTRIRNRCELTGRPRGVYRKFKLSRIMLRELGSKGWIPGLIKSSW